MNETNDINSILTGLDLGSLNGSTAPNSSPTNLSTPVNTSGGNTNTSGFSLGSVLSGLSGLGTSAANAYALFNGAQPATKTATPSAAASSWTSYLPWILGGGALIVLIALFARK
ncbi:MAG TPA: hypothetical protein VNV43_00185 [Candidatus Acidoferrales bacterium]|jgi:hypothetical protein|nr:hypothetical protein [Candidatus Acidoferrales bacterium]